MHFVPFALALSLPFFLSACGGSDTGSHQTTSPPITELPPDPSEPEIKPPVLIPIPAFTLTEIKLSEQKDMLRFLWDGDSTGITYTVCVEDKTLENNCRALANVTNKNSIDARVHKLISASDKPIFILATNASGLFTPSKPMNLTAELVNSLIQYFKASNTEANDEFGGMIAISDDGNTMVVGVSLEDSMAKGINDATIDIQKNNLAKDSGAVYAFKRTTTGWVQQAYIKSSNSLEGDLFGYSIAISANGKTMVVGARSQGSGRDSSQPLFETGAAYVFQFNGEIWTEKAILKAEIADKSDRFGNAVAISADGNRIAVTAYREDSSPTTINPSDNSVSASGAAYTFTQNQEGVWTQESFLKGSNTNRMHYMGHNLSFNAKGDILAVGTPYDDTNATAVNGVVSNNLLPVSGAVYIFRLIENKWTEIAYIKSNYPKIEDRFGASIALNAAGNRLAVGAPFEDSNATGVDGNQADNSSVNSGAVFVYSDISGTWSQQAYLKASNTQPDYRFGFSVAINGNQLAIGSVSESSGSIGINGDESNKTAPQSGAAYLFKLENETWRQTTYIKAPKTGDKNFFGAPVLLSGAGDLVVGATGETSIAVGINGDKTTTGARNAGAAYFY